MGQVGSMISRRANRWNAENRAHKIIGKDKPTPAPKYPSNLKEIQKALESMTFASIYLLNSGLFIINLTSSYTGFGGTVEQERFRIG